MANIFITGSSDGVGLLTAQLLSSEGHTVVLHARNQARADETRARLPAAHAILLGDLSSIRETRALADQAAALGPFDAVIHNAAIGFKEKRRLTTEDGLAHVFAINSLAPYLLTALIPLPPRIVYISSKLHLQGDATLQDLNWTDRPWRGNQAYSDSKLHNVLLSFALARLHPELRSNAVTPGWVPTKMSGPRASDDLEQSHLTQSWLSTSPDAAGITGKYFYHLKPARPLAAASDPALQDRFLAECQRLTGVSLP